MKPFSLLIKPVSGDCNIDCQYCFYKRALGMYPEAKRHKMSAETLEAVVSGYLAHRFPSSGFCFQGGEPTLAGLDFFKTLIDLQRRHGSAGQTIGNSMQTHGMNLDDDWGRFLARYRFFLGVSIDGPEDLHNAYRKTYGGNGTHADVLRGVKVLRSWNIDFNVLVLLNKVNVQFPDRLWEYFGNEGFHHLQFIPCIEYHGATSQPREFAIAPEAYGDFLCAIFDRWEKEGVGTRTVRIFDNVLEHLVRRQPSSCFFNDCCDSYFMLEHNGDVYPCDFYGYPEWRIGNINESSFEALAATNRRRHFASRKSVLHDECRKCQWVSFCQGACPSHRDRHDGLSYFCEGYKRFYSHTWERFAAIRDRHLTHLMAPPESALLQVDTTRPARNAPCPCGSGRKYKHCCLGKPAPKAATR